MLGPNLFSLYTTQLCRIIGKHGVCREIFADDVELYRAFHPDPASALAAVCTDEEEECCRDVKAWITAYKIIKHNDELKLMLSSVVPKPVSSRPL